MAVRRNLCCTSTAGIKMYGSPAAALTRLR